MRLSRWLVPAVVVATVAGGVVVSSAAAGGAPQVPDRTPAQVLASIATSRVSALSGTIATRAELGLPSLPSSVGGERAPSGPGAAAADPQAVLIRLLTGRTTLRVWVDGPQRQRVQLLDPFAEIAYVHDGQDVWTFDTGANAGTHLVLPDAAALPRAGAGHGAPLPGLPSDLRSATPEALAGALLARLDPTTAVTLEAAQTVAGRAAYTVVVTPRTEATLVDRAVLAVDATNGVPLRVQVYARGHADPVLESGFTAVDFATPDADRFAFTPPAGADITTTTVPTTVPTPVPAPDGTGHPTPAPEPGDAVGSRPGVEVQGTGWATILQARPGASAGDVTGALDSPLVAQLTTPVDGGRALRTRLFSVLLTDDGRVLAGAVPVDALVAAAR